MRERRTPWDRWRSLTLPAGPLSRESVSPLTDAVTSSVSRQDAGGPRGYDLFQALGARAVHYAV